MKPGELERNLSRLAGLATRARKRLDSIDEQVAHLRSLLEEQARPLVAVRTAEDEHDIDGANPTRAPNPAQAEVLFK